MSGPFSACANGEWRIENSSPPYSLFSTRHSRQAGKISGPAEDVSRLARGLEHGRVEGVGGAFSRPDHELERLEVALARFQRGSQRRLALRARGRDAAGEQQRVAEHDQPVLEPQVEMPDPELLVDLGDQLDHLVAPRRRNFQLERARKLQPLDGP